MADDFDVEALLEAPYSKDDAPSSESKEKGSHRSTRDKDKKKKDKDRERGKDRGKDKRRDKDRKRSRSRDRKDRRRSKSRDKKDRRRSQSRERRGSRDKSRDIRMRDRPQLEDGPSRKEREALKRRGGSRSPRRRCAPYLGLDQLSPGRRRSMTPELPVEERDRRTVLCMQMAQRIRPKDLEDFFSSVGKVTDARIITDNRTRRSKGIAYVEFANPESVTLAIALTGQRLLGVPIIVQPSQAEKNRTNVPNTVVANNPSGIGPMRLYIGSLHFNISEDMLRSIFEPFGKILDIMVNKDPNSGESRGFGFLTYANSDDAKRAMDQLNGFELAGRAIKIGHVTERQTGHVDGTGLDNEEMDRAGIDLGATGRLQLMAKLAQGTGFEIPQYAASALQQSQMSHMPQDSALPPGAVPAAVAAASAAASAMAIATQPSLLGPPPGAGIMGAAPGIAHPGNAPAPPIATQCFMLSNMFDPATETAPNWDHEIRDDVGEECSKHGGAVHIYVDKASPQGNVYVKCSTIPGAAAAVNALHGRFFAGKVITANYVPVPNYHTLFPDSASGF